MKSGAIAAWLLALVLLACALAAARVAASLGAVGLEFGRARTASLDPELARRVAAAPEGLLVQWFATPSARMPSDYAAVEQAIGALFPALEAAAPGRVRTQVLHPEDDAEAARYAAALGLGPFRARRIEHDRWQESELWSCLRIVHGARGAAVVRALTPELAQRLQPLIAAHLAEIDQPRRPVLALSAPPGHTQLRALLDTLGDVREIDYDLDAEIPADADLLFWIAPARADARHLARLAAFLERGGSAFVAASRWTASYGDGEIRFAPTGAPLDALLPELGLSATTAHVLESAHESAGQAEHAWHLLRSIGSRQDFRAFPAQPNGTLAFAAPSPVAPLAERLLELGYVFSALASSSDRCFQVAPTAAALRTLDLARGDVGTAVPAQTLVAQLRPLDPTRGSLVFAASASPLGDASIDDPAFVHREFVRVLVRGLASSERRALSALARARPLPLPELSRTQRWTWRSVCVLLVPALLVLAGLLRGAFQLRSGALTSGWFVAAPLLFLMIAGLAASALPLRWGFDASADSANQLAPELPQLAADVAVRAPLSIETLFSDRARLPPEMRPRLDEARALCSALARATTGVEAVDIAADSLADDAAAARGLRTLRGTSQREEGLASHAFFAAIVLEAGDRRALLEFPDAASFDHLPFRIAVALHTLATGRAPRLAIASDPMRMTPAEALELYQKRGLFAPGASDPFAAARALLERHGFESLPVAATAETLPADIDAFVWFQPRRDASRRIRALAQYLEGGGKALVCAQPYRVRPRQRDAGAAEPTLWPEPLFPDLDRLWLPAIGVQLAPELVFDEAAGTLEIDGTAERGGQVVAASATVSNPLLVRSTPAGRAPSAVTGGVGDLLLPSPARLRLDAARLRELGLEARPVLATSDRAWTHLWSGGMLARETWRPRGERIDPLVIAAQVSGTFPGPAIDPALGVAEETGPAGRGDLVLVACSELFTDANLRLPGYDHARFLLQATAALALPPRVQAVLARRASTGGFGSVDPAARILWRTLGLAAGPLILFVCIAFWRRARTRRIEREVSAA